MSKSLEPVREYFWSNKPDWTVEQFVFLSHGHEPMDLSDIYGIGRDLVTLQRALTEWRVWAPNCPGICAGETRPFDTPVPKTGLIKWAMSLRGVTIPDWITSLVKDQDASGSSDVPTAADSQFGDKEYEKLLKTIAVMAKALADKTPPVTGTKEEPNRSQIAELCASYAAGIHGLSAESIRKRIAKGLRLL